MSKNRIIFIIALVIIMLIIFINFHYRVNLIGLELTEVIIEFLPDAKQVTVTDATQINEVLVLLNTEKWNVDLFWTKKTSANIKIVIDNKIIGLFDFDSNDGYVNDNGRLNYYKIPRDIFEKVFKFYNEQSTMSNN